VAKWIHGSKGRSSGHQVWQRRKSSDTPAFPPVSLQTADDSRIAQDDPSQFFEDQLGSAPISEGYQQADLVVDVPLSDGLEYFVAFFCEGETVADVSIEIAANSQVVVADVVVAAAAAYEIDWFSLYDQPEPDDHEWSGPVQAQAPPDVTFNDDWNWLEDASDSTLEILEDSDPVAPPAAVDAPPAEGWTWDDEISALAVPDGYQQTDIVPNTDASPPHEWDWDEFAVDDIDAIASPVQADAVTAPAILDPEWDWINEVGDELTDDSAPVGADIALAGLVDDAWDWSETADADIDDPSGPVGAAIVVDVRPFFGDDAEHLLEEAGGHVVSDGYQQSDNAATGAPTIVSTDDWDFALEVDEDFFDDFGNEDLDEPVLDDPYDWFTDTHEGLPYSLNADSAPVGADLVVPVSMPVDDAHDWTETAFDEWDGSSAPVGADVAAAPQLAPSEDWNWTDDSVDEPQPEDTPVAAAIEADAVSDVAWDWFTSVEDDWFEGSQSVGADLIIPPSQFTDDGWDWSVGYPTDDGLEVDLAFYETSLPVGGVRVYIRGRRSTHQVTGRDSIHEMDGRRQILTVKKVSE
jgi:hypothetical protein